MKRTIGAGALAFSLCIATVAWAAPPKNFDARVAKIASEVGVPGISVAIVENGKVTLAKGYGVRRLDDPAARVDSDTLFQIGSVSKAFTAAALARLVDSGKVGWDDKVIDHIPYFQMYDSWVTREMTVRDLFVHNSGLGLGAGDLMLFPQTTRSREDVVRSLRYIKPATSFRSGYAYDNVLYVVAGQLIEEVSGKSWERFVKEDLLVPGGMLTATSSRDDRRHADNRAWPHGRRDGPMVGMGTQVTLDDSGKAEFDPDITGVGAPAGGIAISANDMARWLSIQLAHGGLPGGGRLFSEDASREMWTPRIHVPIGRYPEPVSAVTPQFDSYAMGWMERDYRGHKLIMHTGAVFGAQSILVLIPEKNIGFSIMINCEDGEAAYGLAYELLDHYLGQPYYNWGAAWQQFVRERDQKAVAFLKSQTETPAVAGAGPSRSLQTYAGAFKDAWYGPVTVKHAGGKLAMDFTMTPGMTGELTPWRYDTFRVTWRNPSIEPAYVTFAFDAEGKVDRISMRPVSPLADFSFDYQDLDLRPAPAASGGQ
ncbi:serine hydrolase [Caulobacter sp. 17J65-9]|uniref:serine hydrolase n=1 Tax=Caulobacter sp. 17J65-9 TaxID=2709382 RepID=UPI0013CB6124|nr:serine hydrolase [Caulobacter sp. 17J65-9]NEX93236.1 serine hydrolase [Caulobacter sp. 17J65-9]